MRRKAKRTCSVCGSLEHNRRFHLHPTEPPAFVPTPRALVLARALAAQLELIAADAHNQAHHGDGWTRDFTGEAAEVRAELFALMRYKSPAAAADGPTNAEPCAVCGECDHREDYHN